jgi:hypothetical protein
MHLKPEREKALSPGHVFPQASSHGKGGGRFDKSRTGSARIERDCFHALGRSISHAAYSFGARWA